jgi:hypothetical protein
LTGERTKRIETKHLQRVGDLKHFSFLHRIIDSYDDTFRVEALSASDILKMACQLNIPSNMSAFKVAVELLEELVDHCWLVFDDLELFLAHEPSIVPLNY